MDAQNDAGTVFVGKKPVMKGLWGTASSPISYVLACLTLLQNGADTVTIKARGRAISRAVDIAQILTKRFATDVFVKSIKIDTEEVKTPETGEMTNVSSIEINIGM